MPPDRRDQELTRLAAELHADDSPGRDADVRFLTSRQLREMRQWGMTIGCHGATHDTLTRCNDGERVDEVVRSKARLEGLLDAPVEFFAYPDGVYDRAARDLASEHYRMAFTAPSAVGSPQDRWRFPRHAVEAVPIRRAMSWWFPWRTRAARAAKEALGYT
jgi:peptidoglycan/xylan/chitin deacetylase (PgdA/CDA1 family)